jgi:hypothetical protein
MAEEDGIGAIHSLVEAGSIQLSLFDQSPAKHGP